MWERLAVFCGLAHAVASKGMSMCAAGAVSLHAHATASISDHARTALTPL